MAQSKMALLTVSGVAVESDFFLTQAATDDLLPDDILPWARETCRDQDDVAKLPNGAWMLRPAADTL
jgi:hypothetical protein